tara:strand:+ start:749 stop:985 length:237 start_codon:yes stop_codon:yes gene_type:complete
MAHGTYNTPRTGSNGSKDRMKNLTDKVLVSKGKRRTKNYPQPFEENPWVSGKDTKYKKVSRARADRMIKRGWREEKKM